jgi:site-specific DNA-methyltransferase (adenine-specific)
MGKKWDYDVPKEEIWVECLRVLKPGGYLLAFAGTRTQHRMAVRIEDAGFEIRDMIAWVYGSGFPKSLSIGKVIDKLQGNEREVKEERGGAIQKGSVAWSGNDRTEGKGSGFKEKFVDTKGNSQYEGWGTALKPALEPITVARKPLSEKSVAENVLKWGTGGINIDECRVGMTEQDRAEVKAKANKKDTSNNIIKGFGNNTAEFGDWEMSKGRFPANLIHDGSDEVVSLFPETKSGARKGGDAYKLGRYEGQKGALGLKVGAACEASNGSASRFFYCAKASKSERNRDCEGFNDVEPLEFIRTGIDGRGNTYETKPNKNHHPTVKPIKLMEYLVKLISRENQVVLDPFMGSGTTGIACKNLNRRFIGIEIDAGYYDIAYQRIHQEPQPQATQESGQEETQEIPTIQQPKQRSLF